MSKLPECAHCQYCLNSPYLVCAVNPHGPEGLTCNDFVAAPEAEANTERNPLGGGYYVGDWIPQPFPNISRDEQLALLDWHPQFTGRCPTCEMLIAEATEGRWRCRYCGWQDAATETS